MYFRFRKDWVDYRGQALINSSAFPIFNKVSIFWHKVKLRFLDKDLKSVELLCTEELCQKRAEGFESSSLRRSPDLLSRLLLLVRAVLSAFFCPMRITRSFPRVMAVYRRFRCKSG